MLVFEWRCPTRRSHSRGVIPVRCSSVDQDLVSRYEERALPIPNHWRHLARRSRTSHRKRYKYSTASSGDKKDLNKKRNSTSGKLHLFHPFKEITLNQGFTLIFFYHQHPKDPGKECFQLCLSICPQGMSPIPWCTGTRSPLSVHVQNFKIHDRAPTRDPLGPTSPCPALSWDWLTLSQLASYCKAFLCFV